MYLLRRSGRRWRRVEWPMPNANAMLGYAYELYGVVVAGKPMVRPIRLRFRGRIRD